MLAKGIDPNKILQEQLSVSTGKLPSANWSILGKIYEQYAVKYSLYTLRHSWATNALRSGMDALTVAVLMGHSDPSTLSRVYQHLAHSPEHMLEQAKRAIES